MRTQLLCTFTKRNRFYETIDIILACNDIVFDKVYAFQNENDYHQLICTYNVEYDEDAIQEVPKEQFTDDLEVGMMFQAQSDQGPMQFSINEILEDTVKIDFNHPMAGKALTFEIEVIDIREAAEEEIAHGHVHGDGGHHH